METELRRALDRVRRDPGGPGRLRECVRTFARAGRLDEGVRAARQALARAPRALPLDDFLRAVFDAGWGLGDPLPPGGDPCGDPAPGPPLPRRPLCRLEWREEGRLLESRDLAGGRLYWDWATGLPDLGTAPPEPSWVPPAAPPEDDRAGPTLLFLDGTRPLQGVVVRERPPPEVGAPLKVTEEGLVHLDGATLLLHEGGGRTVLALAEEGARTGAFAVSAEGARIAWVVNGEVRLLARRRGEVCGPDPMARLAPGELPVRDLTFTPDGEHLVYTQAGHLRLWRVPGEGGGGGR